MLHFLAYGNSDQASFRNPDVQSSFDILTVPSTIAAYYADATAAFVLSSSLQYMIEPRTPLFQGPLDAPRASHFALSKHMGESVDRRMNSAGNAGAAQPRKFGIEFYSNGVCEEVVQAMIRFQREYGQRASDVSKKLNRYRSLLIKAGGMPSGSSTVEASRGPVYVLCPYFAVRTLSDPWFDVMGKIWEAAAALDDPGTIAPVVSFSDVFNLKDALESVPAGFSNTIFYWVPGFNERRVSVQRLKAVRDAVSEVGTARQLVNLYGGYFSILLSKLGLEGFSNGLGYSESREWPTLDATGAAPARYYVRRLHAYLPTATATTLTQNDRHFRCKCEVCEGGDRPPNDLSYHELKRHFALSRKWELRQVRKRSIEELCAKMQEDAVRCEQTLSNLPTALNIQTDHLVNWSLALTG